MSSKPKIRFAIPADSRSVLNLLSQLAAFEGEPGGIALDEATLTRDAFCDQPRIEILLAEIDHIPLGLLILYHSYSSWRAKPAVMIHDLFVEEAARGSGAGRALVEAAARRAIEVGACRLDVNVLNWNQPARQFYDSLGFIALPDWMPHRLEEQAMIRLAEGKS
jgi:GNAT superfamily N-acetyltransferase